MSVSDCLSATGNGFINLSQKCPKAVTITLLVAAILIALAGSYGLLSHYNFVKDYLFLPKEASIALTSTGASLMVLFSAMIHCQRMDVSRADSPGNFLSHSQPIEVTEEDAVCLQGTIERGMAGLDKIVKDALIKGNIENLKSNFEVTDEGNLVFTHHSRPGLIFKVGIDDDRVSRFRSIHHNMVVAKKVCDENNLDRLEVPSCVLEELTIQGKIYPVLVMDYYTINHDPAVQKMLYLGRTDHLKDAIKQLATFIRLTGWNFVTWKKMPILEDPINDYSTDQQYRVLLLINEEMNSPEQGIMGGKVELHRKGLRTSGLTTTSGSIELPGLLACIPPSYRHLVLPNPLAVKKELGLTPVESFFVRRKIFNGSEDLKYYMMCCPFDSDSSEEDLERSLLKACNDEIKKRSSENIPLIEKRRFIFTFKEAEGIEQRLFVVATSLKQRGIIFNPLLEGRTLRFYA